MPVFIVPMLAGLAGLVVMAIPGLSRHGGGHTHTGHTGHVGHAGHGLQVGKGTGHAAPGHAGPSHAAPGHAAPGHPAPGHVTPGRAPGAASPGHAGPAEAAGGPGHLAVHPAHVVAHHGAMGSHSILEILDPRLLCSLAALFGASGQIAVASGLSPEWAAVLAVPAAVGLEWAVVGRLWRLALNFQGQPESPMDALLYDEVDAVTPFHNGKGMVRAVKDGRSVQLVAHLQEEESGEPVKNGDRLRIVDVDPKNERVTVTRI